MRVWGSTDTKLLRAPRQDPTMSTHLALVLGEVHDPGAERELDLHERLRGVVHEVLDLAGVDAHDTEEEVPRDAQGQRHRRVHDGLDRLADVRLEDLDLRGSQSRRRKSG